MASDKAAQGRDPAIFSVQHFCLHDGPGVRSIVFFKGCPLRCQWCQNPESWSPSPEPAFKPRLCIDCKTCVDVCPEKAILKPGHCDQSRCRLCFSCADHCPSGAMTRFGNFSTTASVMDQLRPEFAYYQSSGGGVTFSGGEPMLFPGFITTLSQRLHHEAIHTTLETCGYFHPDVILTPIPQPVKEAQDKQKITRDVRMPAFLSDIDLVLFDVKLFDDVAHRKFCGKGNAFIKKNLSTLAYLAREHAGPVVWPRLPLIPHITDTKENLVAWSEFLHQAGLPYLTIVPYHNLGASKRQWLNLPPAPDIAALTDDDLQRATDILKSCGIACFTPGEEEWDLAEIIFMNQE